jgi:hypothetical protein
MDVFIVTTTTSWDGQAAASSTSVSLGARIVSLTRLRRDDRGPAMQSMTRQAAAEILRTAPGSGTRRWSIVLDGEIEARG